MPPYALVVTEALEASNSWGPCHSSRMPSRTRWQDPIVGNATLPGYIIQDINWNKLEAFSLLASFHYARKCDSGCWGKRHHSSVLSSSELCTLWCQLDGRDGSIRATMNCTAGWPSSSSTRGKLCLVFKTPYGKATGSTGYLILSLS